MTPYYTFLKHKTLRGYTLLEMIVSVGLFSIIMLLATGAYFNLIESDRQARAVNDVVTNLSFAVDSMGREIRTGTGYACNQDTGNPNCPSGGTSFSYVDSSGRTVIYERSNNQIIATINGAESPLTDPRISIDTLAFYVRGVGTLDTIQPQTLISIQGSIVTKNRTVSFTIQTTATQRYLEL